jgi:hypothetical protein
MHFDTQVVEEGLRDDLPPPAIVFRRTEEINRRFRQQLFQAD